MRNEELDLNSLFEEESKEIDSSQKDKNNKLVGKSEADKMKKKSKKKKDSLKSSKAVFL